MAKKTKTPIKEIKIYALPELAPILGVTYRSLQNYVKNGTIQGFKVGGRWRVSEEEVRRILTEGSIKKRD